MSDGQGQGTDDPDRRPEETPRGLSHGSHQGEEQLLIIHLNPRSYFNLSR